MLNVKIYSFSYKKSGIPVDDSSNGGGFVFDCRFIYNPGREESFRILTGKDKAIIEFLDNNNVMQEFLNSVFSISSAAVDNYLHRNFTNLMFSFGCTGGQHRSVYSAERLAEYLKEKYGNKINVSVSHNEFPELNSQDLRQ
ncbi:MAG TPA: RNase adapter RapZ [Ignavibacteria bacterium]|nr:RNase adapter RapZ [Ignavibacteria bacterium]HMQ98026.1 RNase adapter RapZ [Ignavibacteria bacterium]